MARDTQMSDVAVNAEADALERLLDNGYRGGRADLRDHQRDSRHR